MKLGRGGAGWGAVYVAAWGAVYVAATVLAFPHQLRDAVLDLGLWLAWLPPLALLLACSGDQPTDDSGDAVAATELHGSSWTLVRGDGPAGAVEPPDGWPVTLSFEADTFGGTASCNGYGGDYTLGDDGSITFTEMASTSMACEPAETMRAEAAFITALGNVDTYRLEGDTLTLTGEGTELVFARQAPVPTSWAVGQLSHQLSHRPAGGTAVAVGHPDPGRGGHLGCR